MHTHTTPHVYMTQAAMCLGAHLHTQIHSTNTPQQMRALTPVPTLALSLLSYPVNTRPTPPKHKHNCARGQRAGPTEKRSMDTASSCPVSAAMWCSSAATWSGVSAVL
jgi:hypothetical protein